MLQQQSAVLESLTRELIQIRGFMEEHTIIKMKCFELKELLGVDEHGA